MLATMLCFQGLATLRLVVLASCLATIAGGALAQAQGQATGYGQVQPRVRPPSGGVALTLGAVTAAGLAAAVAVGVAAATSDGGSSDSAGDDTADTVTATTTK